jgi:Na+/H+ antiporter NhaC
MFYYVIPACILTFLLIFGLGSWLIAKRKRRAAESSAAYQRNR